MDDEVRWEAVEYESRLDALADDLPEFIDAVLGTIDYEAARADDRRWAAIVWFFAGCADAARSLASSTGAREHVIGHLDAAFPGARAGAGRADAGYEEFMDWVSDPAAFRPTRLHPFLERVRAE